jgi:tetratricopeptide (TPR) repeat protein
MDFKVHDYDAALTRLLALSAECWTDLDDENRFALAANLGFCYRELGRFEDAITYYDRACACLGSKSNTEATRIRWNVATLLIRCGRLSDAADELMRVRGEFDRLEMRSESTLVGLEIAELLLIENRVASAESLCRELCSRIESAGLSSTSRAMTALGFLQEALSLRKATPTLVRHVRNFVERLPEEPSLLFAPPPL